MASEYFSYGLYILSNGTALDSEYFTRLVEQPMQIVVTNSKSSIKVFSPQLNYPFDVRTIKGRLEFSADILFARTNK